MSAEERDKKRLQSMTTVMWRCLKSEALKDGDSYRHFSEGQGHVSPFSAEDSALDF